MRFTLPPQALGNRLLTLPFPTDARLTLRSAGDMKLDEAARAAVFTDLGVASRSIARVSQVHGRTVEFLPAQSADPWRGERWIGEADGLATEPGGPVLAVLVADCVPLFCYDTRSGACALLHSGWRGTGILKEGCKVLEERFGTAPEDLAVLAGPGIHSESYEVDEVRAGEFRAWGEDAVVERDGGFFLDLYAANRGIANELGIGMFTEATHCTAADPVFGSYRRQGAQAYTSMLAILIPPSKD